jgi:hypothetical protein
MTSLQPSVAAGPSQHGDELASRNCVDRCIVNFCHRMDKDISVADLDDAIKWCGLPSSAYFRSLGDCKRILSRLGVSVVAIPVKIHGDASFPDLGIYYYKPMSTDRPGHVVVISRAEGNFLSVFDPGSKKETSRKAANEIRDSFDTIALVPTSVAWGMSLRFVASFLVGVGIVAAIAIFGATKLRTKGNALFLSILAAASAIGPAGCRHDDNVGGSSLFRETTHDFEVIRPDALKLQVQHTFRLTNAYDRPITIKSIVASCSCVTPIDELRQRVVGPGEAVDIPIAINLESKFGDFRENVLVAFESQDVATQLLSLKGFVIHSPLSRAKHVIIKAITGHVGAQDAEVVYVRTPADLRSQVRTYRLESDDGESHRYFNVHKPMFATGPNVSGGFVDSWRFPITYNSPPSNKITHAKLRIIWATPPSQTIVDLVGTQLKPLDIEEYIYLPRVPVGAHFVERIPFRAHDPNILNGLEAVSSHPELSCKVLPQKNFLELTAHFSKAGKFRAAIQVACKSQRLVSIQIEGNATSF